MTKQEEIRERMLPILCELCDPPTCQRRVTIGGEGCDELNFAFIRILNLLQSKGVVTKVDRELPREYALEIDGIAFIGGFNACVEAHREAGYVAVEPLI